jgi:hypothetical protein
MMKVKACSGFHFSRKWNRKRCMAYSNSVHSHSPATTRLNAAATLTVPQPIQTRKGRNIPQITPKATGKQRSAFQATRSETI